MTRGGKLTVEQRDSRIKAKKVFRKQMKNCCDKSKSKREGESEKEGERKRERTNSGVHS